MMYYIIVVGLVLVGVVYFLFMVLFYKNVLDMDTMTPYECGFNSFSYARLKFSYRFFLISILFIVFDVEMVLFLASPFGGISMVLTWLFMLLMLILILGLMYEYSWGSLDWLY